MKYLVWRGGKPRWSPGPNLRERGFKGQDLRHPSGEWMSLSDAMHAAKAFNDLAGVPSTIPADIVERQSDLYADQRGERGYVYFMFAGQRVKIGYSIKPLQRAQAIGPTAGQLIEMYAFVPGTMADERRVHFIFDEHRIEGEWFFATQRIMNLLFHSLQQRRIVFDTNPP